MGGLIALEMARQLQAQGEEVQLLALFDTKAPDAEEEFAVIDDASLLASFALHLGLSPEQIQDATDASVLLEHAKAANIALFRAAETSNLGWENLEVYNAPGSHMTILREPNVSVLAERLIHRLHR